MSDEFPKKLLEKKFILHIVAQVMSTILVATDKISGEQWTELNMVILGAFTIISTAEQFATKRGDPA